MVHFLDWTHSLKYQGPWCHWGPCQISWSYYGKSLCSCLWMFMDSGASWCYVDVLGHMASEVHAYLSGLCCHLRPWWCLTCAPLRVMPLSVVLMPQQVHMVMSIASFITKCYADGCPWSMQQPKTMLMSIGYAITEGHVVAWGWLVLLPEAIVMPVIQAAFKGFVWIHEATAA